MRKKNMTQAKAISVEATTSKKAVEVANTPKVSVSGDEIGVYKVVKILGEELKKPEKLSLENNTKPVELPDTWDYDANVSEIKMVMLSWNGLTEPIMKHLFTANKILKSKRLKAKYGIESTKTWDNFCEELGTSRQVINRWLCQWFKQPKQTKASEDASEVLTEFDCGVSGKHLYIYRRSKTYPNGKVKYSHYIRYTNGEEPSSGNTEPNTENTGEATE